MKTKTKKDKKELPVTQAEYTDAQMMVLFVLTDTDGQ